MKKSTTHQQNIITGNRYSLLCFDRLLRGPKTMIKLVSVNKLSRNNPKGAPMKNLLALFCIACLFACTKHATDKPLVAPIIQAQPDTVKPPIPEGIGYDSLRILVKEGSVLHYERIDSLFLRGWSSMDSASILASLHWENKHSVPDIAGWPRVYTDTSRETITIGGRIRINELRTKYTKETLQNIDSVLTDTSSVTVWWVKNHTWNRMDTLYVYLSTKALWMFSLTPYGNMGFQPPNINLHLPLKKNGLNGNPADYKNRVYSKADTVLSVKNTIYSQGLYISAYIQNCFGNCIVFNSIDDVMYLSANRGMIQYNSAAQSSGYTTDGHIIKIIRKLLP